MSQALPFIFATKMDPLLFAETGQLVVKLTNEVHRLRGERNALQQTVESISAENLGLKAEIREKEEASAIKTASFESKLADLETLSAKLVEKGKKYQIICDLHVLERTRLEETIEEQRNELHRQAEIHVKRNKGIEEKVAVLAQERDDAVSHSAKLKKYILSLEAELKTSHSQRVEDSALLNKAYEQIAVLKEEISMQKVLTLGRLDVERLGDTYGLISSRAKFEEMRDDLKRATSFLKTAMEKYDQ